MLGVLVVIFRTDQIAGPGISLGQRQIALILSLRALRALRRGARGARHSASTASSLEQMTLTVWIGVLS
jgi:hypothetical protein